LPIPVTILGCCSAIDPPSDLDGRILGHAVAGRNG
jgi:hypothetical protein